MDLFDRCHQYYPLVTQTKAKGLYPYFIPIDSEPDRAVYINGKRLLMLGSNNYLGLTTDPRLKEAAMKAIEKYGTGCTGSRFLNGTLDIHEELEHRLAEFVKKEDCIVFSTGFQTNLGTIAALVRKGDVVITDKSDHASIVDGCRLSFGHTKRFLHNNMEHLEKILGSLDDKSGKLIIVDGIFSMDGDITDLPDIVFLAKKHNAKIMVDDAHSMGVLGKNGAGTTEHFGLADEVDLIMGTFSKSFASLGGFIAGKREVIAYIRHQARALIFSASMPPSAVATALEALKIMKSEPERRERLWRNAKRILKGLKKLGYNTGTSCTPIIPLIIGDDMKTLAFWKALYEAGLFTNAVIPPGVPPKRSLIRTSYMATHTNEDIEEALSIFKKVGKKMEIM